MALKLADRVVETSTSTGTGDFALNGAQTGYQAFSSRLSNGDTTYYTIQGKNVDGTLNGEWEVGVGTYNTNTLTRDTVLESSNADAKVVFGAGDKDVFIDLPSEKVITTAGTGISISGNTITNTLPDQVVSITGGGLTTVTGTYPNFTVSSSGGSGGGDVTGPASSTDNAITRFDGTTGKLIQNSVVTISDTGDIAGATTITDINYVDFNTGYSTTLGAGQLGWDGNNTLGLGMIGGNVIQHIGEDQFFYCKASSAITKGQVVMFTGAVGASGVPTGAPATGITDGTYIMGVAAESIALNGFGLVQSFGTLRNVNTSGYADGDILWYDPSVTGGLTNTKPSAPNVKAQIAAVINGGSSGGGTILIRIDPGSTLGGTDSNAQINGASNGQIITYDGTNGYWKNTSVTAGTAISVSSSSTGVLTITNSAPDQTVVLTGAGTTTVTGTYPNFTITSNDQYTGTVTSVSGTGTVNGITLTGTVTTSGSLTLGGTLSGIGNSQLTNSSVTFNGQTVALGASGTITANTTNALTVGTGLSLSSGTTFDGSAAKTISIDSSVATLTGSQTLTNKTLTTPAITDPVITGTIQEDVYALTDASTVDIDPGNGSIQTLTLTGTGRTLTFTNMLNGEAITLMVNDGTSGTITTWNCTFINNNGSAPTLSLNGYTVISIWKVAGVVYAAVVGVAP